MLEAFKDIVPDIFAIGTYCIRSGGTTAATSFGVPDGFFFLAAEPVNWLRTGMFKILYLHVSMPKALGT